MRHVLRIRVARVANEPPPVEVTENSRLVFDLQVLQKVLKDNQAQLVAQNVLQKGHSEEQAEEEIGRLLSLLGTGKNVSFRLLNETDSLKLELNLNFANE